MVKQVSNKITISCNPKSSYNLENDAEAEMASYQADYGSQIIYQSDVISAEPLLQYTTGTAKI